MKDNKKKVWIWIAVIVIAVLCIWGIAAANNNQSNVEDQIQEEVPKAVEEDSGVEEEAPTDQEQADQQEAENAEVEGTVDE